MEDDINYGRIGALLILFIVLAVLGILWYSSICLFTKYSKYLVYMQESVAGLSTDSDVEFNGIKVGRIKNIVIDRLNPRLIEITLNIKSSTPITLGTVARLATKGPTTLAYIALKNKNKDVHPLLAKHGQPYPVIPTEPSLFLQLDSALDEISTNYIKIKNALGAFWDDDNVESMRQIFYNLTYIKQTFSTHAKDLESIWDNSVTAIDQLPSLFASGRRLKATIEMKLLATIYDLRANIDAIIFTLIDVSTELKDNPSILLTGTEPAPPGPYE